MVCIDDMTGEYKGMLTPEHFNILYKIQSCQAFWNPRFNYNTPKSFASELLGLLNQSTLHGKKTPRNIKINTPTGMLSLPIFTLPSKMG